MCHIVLSRLFYERRCGRLELAKWDEGGNRSRRRLSGRLRTYTRVVSLYHRRLPRGITRRGDVIGLWLADTLNARRKFMPVPRRIGMAFANNYAGHSRDYVSGALSRSRFCGLVPHGCRERKVLADDSTKSSPDRIWTVKEKDDCDLRAFQDIAPAFPIGIRRIKRFYV